MSCSFQGQEMGSLLPVRKKLSCGVRVLAGSVRDGLLVPSEREYHGLARRRQEANISTLEGEETLRSPLGQPRRTPFTWAQRREQVAS